jgi:hypothetical protein
MFALPPIHQQLLAGIPFPKDFRVLPDHFLIRTAVYFTNELRGLVPDFTTPKTWRKFRAYVTERRSSLKIGLLCTKLYEDESYPMNAFFHFSFMEEIRQEIEVFAKENGYGDLEGKDVANCDQERLREFLQLFMDCPVQGVCKQLVEKEITETDIEAGKRFWEKVFPRLPLTAQATVLKDSGIYMALMLFFMHNSVAVMAYGETITSLFRRAVAAQDGSDDAMCKAIRIDSGLSEHPVFMARHQRAIQEGDESFLRRYNNTASPLPSKIRYPGLYAMFATLDAFGMLHSMTALQLLDLCDHAKLDRWENRIEDVGYVTKRRLEYLANKFR